MSVITKRAWTAIGMQIAFDGYTWTDIDEKHCTGYFGMPNYAVFITLYEAKCGDTEWTRVESIDTIKATWQTMKDENTETIWEWMKDYELVIPEGLPEFPDLDEFDGDIWKYLEKTYQFEFVDIS